VIFGGGLGDLVALLPSLLALRRTHPKAHIEMLGPSSWLPLLEQRGYVDRGVSLEAVPLHMLFRPSAAADKNPFFDFLEDLDLIVSWFGDGEGVFERNLEAVSKGRAHVFPLRNHARFAGHISEYYLATLASIGVEVGTPCYRILPPKGPARARLEDELPGIPLPHPPFVCIHPGSGSPTKNWPLESFIGVARQIARRSKPAIVFVLGPAEQEYLRTDRIRADIPSARIIQEPSICGLATLFEHSLLYVGNDSGPTHLAAATGAPTIALFGPTSPERWGPRGPQVRVIERDIPCRPCTSEAARACAKRRCLTDITPETVLEVAVSLLGSRPE